MKHQPAVLHITTFLQGGAGKVLAELACAQKKRGQNVVVVADSNPCPGYETYSAYRTMLARAGVPLIEVNSTFKRELRLNVMAAEQVRQLIEEFQSDVIHAHAAIPALIGIIAAANQQPRIPVLMSMQGWGNNKTEDQRLTDVAVMNLVDMLVPVSEASATLMRTLGVINPRLEVVYNAVDDAEHVSRPADDSVWQSLRGWKRSNTPVLGCIGSIGVRKNQSALLRALALLPQPRPKCILVGEEEAPGSLASIITESGLDNDVLITGYRDDAALILKELTCLVLPSRSEGLPLTILEAFRSQVPVVGSNIPSIAELIEDGVNGRLYPLDDDQLLAHVLEDVITSPENRKKWSEAARFRYEERFTFAEMDSHYDRLYQLLLSV